MAESHLTTIASESVTTGAIMPLVSLKKHWKISLGVFATLFLLAIPIAWKKGTLYYSVTAVVSGEAGTERHPQGDPCGAGLGDRRRQHFLRRPGPA
ncbi:MAG: hypothetical protein PHU14_06465, partial [Methylovulum sp.]|nr:hypothetical protein [Methylovulum sp.]